jgi:hypothetical protein
MAVLPPRRRCPASPRRTLLPLHRSYGLMRQTCCPPCGFGIASHAGSLQVAVSPCWAQALPVVISANPSLRVWTPTPAAPRVHVPVTSPRTLAFPGETAGRRVAKSPTATSVGGNITELQSFTNVQTHKFARHTGSSHPCVLRRRAAVAFTSAPIRARYLPLQRICFPSKTGQLTEGGLPPPKIGSLDGCSASRVAICLPLSCMPSSIPRRNQWVHASLTSPSTSAFPVVSAGRLPHHLFRGLLNVHSRYGLHDRQVP